jgi:outer membrane protein TolC
VGVKRQIGHGAARAGLAGALALLLGGCFLSPQPLTTLERAAEAAADREAMFANQEPLRHPLTLREAFHRALAYNLDARVKVMEEALAHNDLDLSRLDLLPKAALNGAFLARNNVDASSSQSIATGQQSLVPSTSQDQSRWIADLTLSWNLLDFGVSYINARQQGDRILVVDEQRRKVIQTTLQDVRRAFWRAAGAQVLHGRIEQAIRATQNALPNARKVETEGLRSPVDSLRYQKALLDLIRQLESVKNLLDVSKIELAALINLPPGQRFTLAVPGPHGLRMRTLPMPVAAMEETALLLNPDIREQSYQARITADEVRKALLRLLPGVSLSLSPNYDSNSFLVNHEWVSVTARFGAYVNSLLIAPVLIQRAEQAELLANLRREAVSIAVLAKLHIAVEQYLAAAADYRRSTEIAEVDQRLYQQITNRAESDVQGDLERVSAQVSTVFSDLRRYQSFADAQAALGRIYAALGIDPAPENIEVLEINSVRRDILRVKAENEKRAPAQAQPEAAPQPTMIAQPSDERMPIDAPKFSWFPSRGATPPADARQEEAAMRATDERHPDNSVTVLEAPESPEAPAQP